LVARNIVGDSGDDGEMEIGAIGAARTVKDDAVRVDQGELIASSKKSDRSAFCKLDAQAIRQNTLNAGGFDPGKLLDLTTTRFERDTKNAAIGISDEKLKDGFASNDAIAADFNLLRLDEEHGGIAEEKIANCVGDKSTSGTDRAPEDQATIERPG